jgi:hypothetical protein
MEQALLGDPDHPHSNQGSRGHPVDPSQVKKKQLLSETEN